MTLFIFLLFYQFFSQVLRDKNENESPELHCKFKSFDEVIESQYFRIMHCVCLQEVDSRAGKDPAENDLVVLICPDEHTTEVFGVIEEVEKTPLRDDDGKIIIILSVLLCSSEIYQDKVVQSIK